MATGTVRNRNPSSGQASNQKSGGSSNATSNSHEKEDKVKIRNAWINHVYQNQVALLVITLLAFFTRFYMLQFPDQVVFDEVHFGKFASYYIRGQYFFDVHPPLAKLLIAFGGFFLGFDGKFEFEEIGLNYVEHGVPYVGLRVIPALFGAALVPLVYLIMQESGYAVITCILTSSLVLLDNSLVTQSRLILLDSQLIFFATLSIFCYIKFYKLRTNAFSSKWWIWLCLTGVSLALTLGCKMVGLFVITLVGVATILDLWHLLDVNTGLSIQQFGQHFAARVFGLIVVPAIVYLSIFWVHFAVLPLSGPGDAYMSPAFQATLKDNPMHASSLNINYGDSISVTHRNHGFYLHSHNARYPLRYADGRVSTEGQQVTGYSHPDTQNNWRIHPAQPFEDNDEHRVLGGDYVRLEHVDTQTFLVTADVASPTMPTNQEMTTISGNVTDRYEDSLWEIVIDNADTEKTAWKTRIHHTAFKHKTTGVYIYAHNVKLPDWGFGQFEVNGNRRFDASHNLWTVHEVVGKVATEAPKNEVATRNFFLKFFELHSQMLIKNNEITSEHPFATRPWQWPITNRGTSFWTKNDTKQQIYILGNPFGYWVGCIFLIMLTTTIVLDVLFTRRGVQRVEPALQRRLYRSGAFLLFAWALHLFPFFLMGRQLFLHHYLPAAVFKYICFGIYFQYVFIRDVDSAVSEPNTLLYPTRHPVVPNTTAYIAGAIIVALQLAAFWYFSPLTYGTVGLTVPQVLARKWVENWDFHFAK